MIATVQDCKNAGPSKGSIFSCSKIFQTEGRHSRGRFRALARSVKILVVAGYQMALPIFRSN